MSTPAAQTVTSPWAAHRRRGEALRDRHRYAAELLTLYLALLEVWEQAWRAARADGPEPPELAGWAADRVVPQRPPPGRPPPAGRAGWRRPR